MRNLLSTMLTTLRSTFMPIWTRLRLYMRPTYWKTQGFAKLREFFARMFNVRPRDKADYYPVARWLVSRRLVLAIVVITGVCSLFLLWFNLPALKSGDGTADQLRTYKYNSLALKFYKGNVRILARDGYTAYVGAVEKGEALGTGSLYRADGSLVYEGAFEASMFNGAGVLNYPDGTVCYEGAFVNNLYSGEGTQYRPSGVKEYAGAFSAGMRNGTGTLYNSGGNAVFTGSFVNDRLLFSELVGKKTSELAGMYTGAAVVYTAGEEYCVEMTEVNAVYGVRSGEARLDEDWTVTGVTVLDSAFPTSEKNLTTVAELSSYFGTPEYYGSTWLDLPEAVAANLLAGQSAGFGRVEMNTTAVFEDSLRVNSYDRNKQVYIYTFEDSGLVYTFYCPGSTSGFLMYSIELA